MGQIEKTFPATPEGSGLYHQAVELYEKIERNNARMISVNGITMGYLEFGQRDGIPLIWAHGSSSTSFEIINVQQGLVEAGYRVIAVDYRGHGRTQIEITDYNTSVYHIADDIVALMDYLDIPKAVIGGLSKGGWIAAAFYDTYPNRVLGLLLEDGGSFSHLRLKEEAHLNLIQPGPVPYSVEAMEKLFDPSIRFKTRIEGLKLAYAYLAPAVTTSLAVEYIAYLLSFFLPTTNGEWVYHCPCGQLFFAGPSREIVVGVTLYSPFSLMQQSQELMLPLVVFRNLDVPMHIIDPDSPTDWFPARHQNEELQKLHPDLVVHEVYDYENSPHEAHIERPECFVLSAKALLDRINLD